MLFVYLVARLHNHHVAPVLLADVTDVLYAVGDDVVGVGSGIILHKPEGIERHSHHIELTTIF